MMMKKCLPFLLFLFCYFCYGQKPPIQFDTYKTWPEATNGDLTTNGKYAFYYIRNQPAGHHTVKVTTQKGIELFSIVDLDKPKFGEDNRYLFGKMPGDSLLRIDLTTGLRLSIGNISAYDLQKLGKAELLLCSGPAGNLSVLRPDFASLFTIADVNQFKLSPDGSILLAECMERGNSNASKVYWITTRDFKSKLIYKGPPIQRPIFDQGSRQSAFMVLTPGDNGKVYLYNDKLHDAQLLVDKTRLGTDTSLVCDPGEFWGFSNDGNRLFFHLVEHRNGRIKKTSENLEIWSYQDAYLGSQWYGKTGLSESVMPRSYLSVVNLATGICTRLLKDDEKVVTNTFNLTTDSVLVIESSFGDTYEDWNKSANATFSLLSTLTGARTVLESDVKKYISNWSLSPYGRFLVYYDRSNKSYICYDMQIHQKRNLSAQIKDSFFYFNRVGFPIPDVATKRPEWLAYNQLLMFGTYDLWLVDPFGNKAVINLTMRSGSNQGIIFLPIRNRTNSIILEKGKLLVSGFNVRTKELGFYAVTLSTKPAIEKLFSDNIYTGLINNFYTPVRYPELIGSAVSGYLLKFERSDCAPNVYYTKDLRSYVPLSNVQPQKSFNWFTTELYTYRDSLGRVLQGVLYKPDNLDTSRKYPVIFNIYELKSQVLNAFMPVEPVNADINIPLMVSNGYLVFLPDMKGILKKPGEGALLSIKAAIKRLSQNSWVDTTKMALVGHSFGGFEVNYIISHSDKFAAAIVSAGVSNMATDVLPWVSGRSKEAYLKSDIPLMKDFIGDDPQAYIDNAPILQAKKIQTPILFIHNDNDGAVNVNETKAFFTVLRSLQKRCWWINYRGEDHGVLKEENLVDYQRRVWDFMDYYLNDGEMPDWLKSHI